LREQKKKEGIMVMSVSIDLREVMPVRRKGAGDERGGVE